jgi:hypothetical protein
MTRVVDNLLKEQENASARKSQKEKLEAQFQLVCKVLEVCSIKKN